LNKAGGLERTTDTIRSTFHYSGGEIKKTTWEEYDEKSSNYHRNGSAGSKVKPKVWGWQRWGKAGRKKKV